MDSIEVRLARLEDAVIQIATLQDPAMLEFPRVGSGPRIRALNEAERRLADLAAEMAANRTP